MEERMFYGQTPMLDKLVEVILNKFAEQELSVHEAELVLKAVRKSLDRCSVCRITDRSKIRCIAEL